MPVFFVKAILIRNHILLVLFYRRDSERFFELQDEFNTFFEWRGSMVYLTPIKHVFYSTISRRLKSNLL